MNRSRWVAAAARWGRTLVAAGRRARSARRQRRAERQLRSLERLLRRGLDARAFLVRAVWRSILRRARLTNGIATREEWLLEHRLAQFLALLAEQETAAGSVHAEVCRAIADQSLATAGDTPLSEDEEREVDRFYARLVVAKRGGDRR